MKKLPIFLLVAIVNGAFLTTACGPSENEKARLDSLRIADSIRRADSIKIADSLKAEIAAAEEAKRLYQKVDEVAAASHADFVVKMYALHKVVSATEGRVYEAKSVVITNAADGKKTTVGLSGSDQSGALVDLVDMGDNKHVKARVHCGGSGPFHDEYIIDVEREKVVRQEADY